MITNYKNFANKPDLSVVSHDFWRMVRKVNWKAVVKGYHDYPIIMSFEHKEVERKVKERLYSNFEYEQIKQFERDFDNLYDQMFKYFKYTLLNSRLNVGLSDDGYSDLLSSLIGFGKTYLTKCINDNSIFVKDAKTDNYAENFGYLFNIGEEEYIEIRTKIDPVWGASKKYNL